MIWKQNIEIVMGNCVSMKIGAYATWKAHMKAGIDLATGKYSDLAYDLSDVDAYLVGCATRELGGKGARRWNFNRFVEQVYGPRRKSLQ